MKTMSNNLMHSFLETINSHSITLLTGFVGSGKTWLLDSIKNQSYNIDKKTIALNGGDTQFTTRDLFDLVSTEMKIITIDEAQLLGGDQIIDIAKYTSERDIKLVVACQNIENVPEQELFKIGLNKGDFAHIELNCWDKESPKPLVRSTK